MAAAAAEWARDNEEEEEEGDTEAGDTEAAEDTAEAAVEVEAASCVEERTLGGDEGSEGNLHGDQQTSQDCSNCDEVTEERRDIAEEEVEEETDELSTSDIQVGG